MLDRILTDIMTEV